jgi:uncharacterized DUF497 family protein
LQQRFAIANLKSPNDHFSLCDSLGCGRWDINKAENNFVKHGVKFEEAVEAFFAPFYQEGDASANNEERNFILGYSFLLSFHTIC